MAAQQYDQMLSSLEAQWQAQKNRAEAEAQAERIKLQVALQQAKDKAAAAEAQAEQAQTDTGADAWRTMLIDRNPFGAKAERGYGGGLSEYWQGAAYDTYRSIYARRLPYHDPVRKKGWNDHPFHCRRWAWDPRSGKAQGIRYVLQRRESDRRQPSQLRHRSFPLPVHHRRPRGGSDCFRQCTPWSSLYIYIASRGGTAS